MTIVSVWQQNQLRAAWFSPLVIISITLVLRVGLPSVLLLDDYPPEYFGFVFPNSHFYAGLSLAAYGLSCFALGYYVEVAVLTKVFRRLYSLVSIKAIPEIQAVGAWSAGIGSLFLLFYLTVNFGGVFSSAVDGQVRGGQTVANTSRYVWIGQPLLVYGSVLCGSCLALRHRVVMGAAVVFAATAFLSILGGRANALAPVFMFVSSVVVMRWAKGPSLARQVVVGIVAVIVLMIYAAFMLTYRGAGLETGLAALSYENMADYFMFSLWYEIGLLNPYAMAVECGSGCMDWQSIPLILGYITSDVLRIETVPPGEFVVQRLISGASGWGIHTGLVVDIYMNIGLLAAGLASSALGVFLRALFEAIKMADSLTATIVYGSVVWTLIWVVFESVMRVANFFLFYLPVLLCLIWMIRLSGSRRVSGRR